MPLPRGIAAGLAKRSESVPIDNKQHRFYDVTLPQGRRCAARPEMRSSSRSAHDAAVVFQILFIIRLPNVLFCGILY